MSDLKGRIALVTGATSGIGKITARELARLGAHVVITARDRARGERTVQELEAAVPGASLELLEADFASFASIRAAAAEFKRRHERLHVLVNNAGALNAKRQLSADGLELTFAVNHLGYFLFTDLLLDVLKASAPARIVNVSSEGHRGGMLDWDDLQWEKRRYDGLRAYCDSKLCNVLFTTELARRLAGSGITVNAVHPGAVASNFALGEGWFGGLVKLVRPFLVSVEKGARTSVFLAASHEVEGETGGYYVRSRKRRPSRAARSEEKARRLWEISERLVSAPARVEAAAAP